MLGGLKNQNEIPAPELEAEHFALFWENRREDRTSPLCKALSPTQLPVSLPRRSRHLGAEARLRVQLNHIRFNNTEGTVVPEHLSNLKKVSKQENIRLRENSQQSASLSKRMKSKPKREENSGGIVDISDLVVLGPRTC